VLFPKAVLGSIKRSFQGSLFPPFSLVFFLYPFVFLSFILGFICSVLVSVVCRQPTISPLFPLDGVLEGGMSVDDGWLYYLEGDMLG
jgi:hypothetical protein